MTHDLPSVDATQREIIAALHVAPVFDAAAEIERRTAFSRTTCGAPASGRWCWASAAASIR